MLRCSGWSVSILAFATRSVSNVSIRCVQVSLGRSVAALPGFGEGSGAEGILLAAARLLFAEALFEGICAGAIVVPGRQGD
jgi:hypothetical protein